MKLELDDPPTEEEVKKAIVKLKRGKVPGIDALPAEVFMAGGDAVAGHLRCSHSDGKMELSRKTFKKQ